MTSQVTAALEGQPSAGGGVFWRVVCPECLGTLVSAGAALLCAEHGPFPLEGGVRRFLTSERARRYAQFLREYRTVRLAEGRGADDPAYYRALPFVPRDDRLRAQWRIRAGSYRALVAHVLAPIEAAIRRPLAVLDLGAGNGWLSWRLAQRGHRVAAVDVFDDDRDGLGAHVRYRDDPAAAPFVSIQADFDRLPLPDGSADLIVFNASLHYSTDVSRSLEEAARVLARGGRVVVLDSPVYRSPESGRRMVAEREEAYRARFGFPSDALASESWFTAERLHEAGAGAGVRWDVRVPWHGVRWALRPWLARARGRREPSAFWMLVGDRVRDAPPAPRRREGLGPGLRRAALHLRHRVLGGGRRHRTASETVAGRRLAVPEGVFNPRLFRTGAWLAEFVAAGGVPEGASVLDLGTGSGAGALAAAGRATPVVAIDVSPDAVRCASANARANGLAARVDVRLGDLFEPLAADERFDVVLFNPPFYRGVPRSASDAAWRSVDVPERFAARLADHLTPRGRALVVLSSDCDVDGWLAPARAGGLRVRLVAERDLGNEVLLLYRIAPPGPARSSGAGA